MRGCRIPVWMLLGAVWAYAGVDLPAVDVRSERPVAERSERPEVPVGLPTVEKGEEVFLFPGLDRAERPEMVERRNALFTVGYGLYDMLASSLVFANGFDRFSYLFTMGREAFDDFARDGRRVYNSHRGTDEADLNMRYRGEALRWMGRLQYVRESGGLQSNPTFFDRTTRRVRVGQYGRWSLSSLSALNVEAVYDYARHGVKHSAGGRTAEYHRAGAGAVFQSIFGEGNSLNISARVGYQGLAGPVAGRDEWRFRADVMDEFVLLSVWEVSAGLGVFYSTRPVFYLLPDLKVSRLVSDRLRWSLYGRMEQGEELFTDHLDTCAWQDAPSDLAAPSAMFRGGTMLESLLGGVLPLTLEAYYASETRRPEFALGADGLYGVRPRNIDSFGARAEAVLVSGTVFDLRTIYGWRMFTALVDHEPMHDAGLRVAWRPWRFDLRFDGRYQTGFRAAGRMQEDLLSLRFEGRLAVSGNMGVFLRLEGEGIGHGLYPPYVERGFSGLVGLRVTLI